MLLIDKKEIDDIVDNHFFKCDKRACLHSIKHFILNNDGPVLVNSKHSVCFPHDTPLSRDKYIRRMERFKKILLDNDNYIHFVYVSVSSKHSGNYTIDGVEIIQELYSYIEQIHDILKGIRTNYKICVFDANRPSDVITPNSAYIIYYDIEPKNSCVDLLPELIDRCNNSGNKII
jgi:hypothetical protein